jgi:hypothetical protein
VNVNRKRYPLKTLIGAPYRSVWEAPRSGKEFLPLKEKPRIQDIGDVNPIGAPPPVHTVRALHGVCVQH